MLLTEDFLERWDNLVGEVDKHHIPIDFVKKVVFRTIEKRQKTINLERLRNQGLNNNSIELIVEEYIKSNESVIHSMEFVLDIQSVANTIQPETDRLLKDM